MWTRTAGTILVAATGIGLLWVGLCLLGAGSPPTGLLINVLPSLAGLAAWVAGQWFCWHAVARHVRPPRAVSSLVDVASGTALAALALTAVIVSIYRGIS
jgi:hypothetical protein